MSVDLGAAPVGTPPTSGQKIQIRASLGLGPNDDASIGSVSLPNGSKIKEGATNGSNPDGLGIDQLDSSGYIQRWLNGSLYIMQQDGFTIRQVLYTGSATPSTTDDDTKGFVVGSQWVLDVGTVFRCLDAITESASWESVLVNDHGLIANDYGNLYNSSGTINNNGGTLNNAGGNFDNTYGTFSNYNGYIDNESGYLYNHSGSFYNTSGSLQNVNGNFDNYEGFLFNENGNLRNNDGAFYNLHGYLNLGDDGIPYAGIVTANCSPVDGDVLEYESTMDPTLRGVGCFVPKPSRVLGGSKSATGTATTTFTVTLPYTQDNTNYAVSATAKNTLSSAIHYINNKTTTTFDVVYLTGLTGAVAFDWILVR